MLETNDYVRCLLIDFSRAFDTVDHALLLAKLVKLKCPAPAVNWISCFLTNRSQYCRYNGILSAVLNINRSIVQGSGIGPTLYIVMKHDLRTISELNDLFKFADDTTLLVPQNTDVDLSLEFQHIKNWAAENRLIINVCKTMEIVLHRPRARCFSVPASGDGVDQVACCKLLGVLFQNNFKMEEHVNFLLTQCSQRLYIVRQKNATLFIF